MGKKRVKKNPNIFLHIGKTGGETVNTVIKALDKENVSNNLLRLGNKWRLKDIIKTNPQARVSFSICDPSQRFIASFTDRLECGRPSDERLWNSDEAVIYSFFKTPDNLAEALDSNDQRLLSAAHFAMRKITLLKRGYGYHFGSVEELKTVTKNISTVVLTENIPTKLTDFFTPLGFKPDDFDFGNQLNKAARKTTKKLSKTGEQNLRTFWSEEYEIYSYLKETFVAK